MKCIILLGVCLTLTALAIDAANTAATSKPFVRSRYSKRWRIVLTTESNINNSTSVTELPNAIGVGMSLEETTIVNKIESKGDTTTAGRVTLLPSVGSVVLKSTQMPGKGSHSTTTEHPKQPGSNGLPLDYDYYGNGGENEEEAAHK
ncbi:uncharacterized protein LOC129235767 [Anastrepha obliqua]|uniref:uncharacterized protein LOC129235767 n=1 Tax=Anastrepha obliqua TaxID=95512 RepID=UPI002409DA70|nr:uncharacterized protein LOC129235767 [Anastrepha obliqua]